MRCIACEVAQNVCGGRLPLVPTFHVPAVRRPLPPFLRANRQRCFQYCNGMDATHFGLKHGWQCDCGFGQDDEFEVHGAGDCSITCEGDESFTCGKPPSLHSNGQLCSSSACSANHVLFHSPSPISSPLIHVYYCSGRRPHHHGHLRCTRKDSPSLHCRIPSSSTTPPRSFRALPLQSFSPSNRWPRLFRPVPHRREHAGDHPAARLSLADSLAHGFPFHRLRPHGLPVHDRNVDMESDR